MRPHTHNDALNVPAPQGADKIVVAALYKFVALKGLAQHQQALRTICRRKKIMGTVLLAKEGINGTISATYKDMQALMDWFGAHALFHDIKPKYSFAPAHIFYRMKVRLKKEIVTMGEPDIDPAHCVGRYVPPQEWDALIDDPETLVIDTRNDYEVAIGTFEHAVNPNTARFRDFPAWLDGYLAQLPADKQPKNIAMFCTGGIRCEKSTSYLVSKGFENIFHLEGGILKYLETQPEATSKWQGECFVFDHRVSVKHGLVPGDYDMCHACRMPLTAEEKNHAQYQAGMSCPKCYGTHNAAREQRFRERQKQIELARARGEKHIGARET